jgi:hypothetical protein
MANHFIEITVDASRLNKNLNKFVSGLPIVAEEGIKESMDRIDTVAMDNLYNPGLSWGHSIVEPSIQGSQVKTLERVSPTRINGVLTYTSPHAFYQEYGHAVGTMYAGAEGNAFPIGASEGKFIGYRESFKLVPGKYFLTRAVQSEVDTGNIRSIFEYKLEELINSL